MTPLAEHDWQSGHVPETPWRSCQLRNDLGKWPTNICRRDSRSCSRCLPHDYLTSFILICACQVLENLFKDKKMNFPVDLTKYSAAKAEIECVVAKLEVPV